jgi:hypothetical protein
VADVKVLSLRQPWAWFVVHGGKRIENRVWNTGFRGEFLLHAAKGMTRDEYDSAKEMLHDVCGVASLVPYDLPSYDTIERGGIVGVARLVGVVRPRHEWCSCDGGVPSHYPPDVEWRWHMREQYGFVLDRVRALPFTACKGSLGFFGCPESVLDGLADPLADWRRAS